MRRRWLAVSVSACVVLGCGGDDGPSGETGAEATETSTGDGSGDGSASMGDSTAAGDADGMSFFVTSEGTGARGGNLGGLAGADAICQQLAEAAGVGGRTWHAYLSSSAENARDRIGTGPWYNYAGVMVAADVESLHADGLSNGAPQHVLTEYGEVVDVGDDYDILTGSQDDGTYYEERTCNDWTSNTADFEARVGHSSLSDDPDVSTSWNNAHSTNGCSEEDFQDDACRGRLYCFAID